MVVLLVNNAWSPRNHIIIFNIGEPRTKKRGKGYHWAAKNETCSEPQGQHSGPGAKAPLQLWSAVSHKFIALRGSCACARPFSKQWLISAGETSRM